MTVMQLLVAVFAAINIIAFFVVATDKRKSIRGNGKRRTPEGKLFFLAVIFGATGVYMGMLVFRHKTKKWYFQLGIPLLIVQNAAILYLAYMAVY